MVTASLTFLQLQREEKPHGLETSPKQLRGSSRQEVPSTYKGQPSNS